MFFWGKGNLVFDISGTSRRVCEACSELILQRRQLSLLARGDLVFEISQLEKSGLWDQAQNPRDDENCEKKVVSCAIENSGEFRSEF